ncbi:MAG: GNAT family N-acetyltransferase [Ruminococcaceae bacterium]|nr:GNAT family N-acetyltransferase [Oscillospiraceae bacterium]
MNIRKAEKKDIKGLLNLLSQVLEVHHRGRPDLFRTGAVKYTEMELSALLCNEERPVFVCTDEDEKVLGYCFCIFRQEKNDNILTDIKTLYIDDLCVDESHRGQHIGEALYRYALEFARSEGCYNVTLNVWALNGPAIKFYEKMGLSVQKIGMEQIL